MLERLVTKIQENYNRTLKQVFSINYYLTCECYLYLKLVGDKKIKCISSKEEKLMIYHSSLSVFRCMEELLVTNVIEELTQIG